MSRSARSRPLAGDLAQIKMRVIGRAADAVVVGLRHLDGHLDGGHLFGCRPSRCIRGSLSAASPVTVTATLANVFCRVSVPSEATSALQQTTAASAETVIRNGLPATTLAMIRRSLRNGPRPSGFCRPAVHHGRPSSFA